MICAGFPTTVVPGGTSLRTTAPAPMIAPLPKDTPHNGGTSPDGDVIFYCSSD